MSGTRWPRLRPRSFRGRVVVSTMLLMAVAVTVVGVGVQVLLEVTTKRDVERVLEDRADAVVATLQASPTVVPDQLDPGVQVYDDSGRLLAGSMERDAQATAARLATTDRPRSAGAGDDMRLRAVPFETAAGERGVVVVSQAATPYEESEHDALLATVALGVLVVALTGVIAHRVTTQALAPVARMAARATEWSEHDLSRRFDLDEGAADDELGQLAATLDGLLDRVAMAIRAEQRLTSELAHELRTPLTAIQGAADLALVRGVEDDDVRVELEQVAASARAMSETITALLDVARDRAAAGVAATSYVAEAVAPVRAMVPAELAFHDETAGSSARIAAPCELVLRVLAPLVDNAVAHARTAVALAAYDVPHGVEISVRDDGDGVDPSAADSLFVTGASGRGGTGLGLGIAQRVARSLGGSVRCEPGGPGATFVVTLPRA